jgi:hypothetical protein
MHDNNLVNLFILLLLRINCNLSINPVFRNASYRGNQLVMKKYRTKVLLKDEGGLYGVKNKFRLEFSDIFPVMDMIHKSGGYKGKRCGVEIDYRNVLFSGDSRRRFIVVYSCRRGLIPRPSGRL